MRKEFDINDYRTDPPENPPDKRRPFSGLLNDWVRQDGRPKIKIAESAGMSRQMLGGYLNGSHEPGYSALLSLSRGFGVSLLQFLTGPTVRYHTTEIQNWTELHDAGVVRVPVITELPGHTFRLDNLPPESGTMPIARQYVADYPSSVIYVIQDYDNWWDLLPGDHILIDLGRRGAQSKEMIVCELNRKLYLRRFFQGRGEKRLMGGQVPSVEEIVISPMDDFRIVGVVVCIAFRAL